MASAMVWSAHSATVRVNRLKRWSRGKFIGVSCALLALIGGASTAEPPTATEGSEAAADKEAFLGRTVVLPPYVVSATRIDQHPWQYGSVPGFEVLTRASEEDTCKFLDALRCGQWLENHFLPEDWRPQAPVPYTVIIDNTELKTVGRTETQVNPLRRRSVPDAFAYKLPASSLGLLTGEVAAGDSDTRAMNVNLYHRHLGDSGYDSVSTERLSRCAPSLPPWLMVGLVGEHFGLFGDNILLGRRLDSARVIFRGALWVSSEETERLLKEIEARMGQKIEIPFIPVGQILTEPPPQGENRLLWESEAALFVRWGLLDPKQKGPAWRQAFLRFVERARYEPVTEPMFAECFGCGFGAMEQILTDYLNDLIGEPVTVDLDFPSHFPQPELKPATADQIGRILSDWLRMQGQSIRQRDPGMSAKFLDAAGRMLTRAYEMDNGLPPDVEPAPQEARTSPPIPQKAEGPVVRMKPFVVTAERIHDPGLLAVFGLYEHDIGDDAKAREFLEKAVKAGVDRPRAYLVLARLRYAEAIADPLGQDGKLSASQATFIFGPAKVALRSSATAEAWGLIVGMFARCEARPSALDIEKIVAGVSRFPKNTPLALRAAQLCVQTGSMTRAAELIDKSLPFVTDEDTKREFQRLRSSLAIGGGSR